VAVGWVSGELGFDCSHRQRFFSAASILDLQPTQPPIQWVSGAVSPEGNADCLEGVELSLHKKTKADSLGCSASLLPFL
jgi:hypothetical protein